MRVIYIGAFLASSLFPLVIFSATQGSLGTTSTGTINVSITIPAMVQVSGLSDIILGSTSSFPATGNTSSCIYSNVSSPLGSYYVTATSANTSGADFRVKDSGTNYIVYSAYWNNTSDPLQTTQLVSGAKTAQQTGGNAVSTSCGGASNANFNLSFSQTQIQGAQPATYTDVVTILITST